VWAFWVRASVLLHSRENPSLTTASVLKKEYGVDDTWVSGYNNELLSYIPSLRVLREGGYEGVDDMDEYGLPAPYSFAVEEN